MKQKLEQLDRDLIDLLGQKIALLKDLNGSSHQRNRHEIEGYLVQECVPDFVWEHLETALLAASTRATQPSPSAVSREVTLIGGQGKMGCFFCHCFSQAGHQVRLLGRQNWNQAEELLGDADLVMICVPFEYTTEVIEKAAPYLNPGAVLADIASIKAPIVEAMLDHHGGPVLGLHPMFGPGTRSLHGQNVIVCPGREKAASQWFLDLLEARGAHLTVTTPEEHDRCMAIVQGVRHFITFSLGIYLAEAGVNLDRLLEFASPLFRLEIDKMLRLCTPKSSLSLELMLASKEHRRAIALLAATSNRLAESVVLQQRSLLQEQFEYACEVFAPHEGRARQEIDRLLTCMALSMAIDKGSELETGEHPLGQPTPHSSPIC